MRPAKDSDFFIELPGVGVFRYGRRTYGDQLAIRREILSLVKDLGDEDPDLSLYAATIATHRVLCVEAPEGWEDIAELDLTRPDTSLDKVFELFALLREKEERFRQGEPQGGEEAGQGAP